MVGLYKFSGGSDRVLVLGGFLSLQGENFFVHNGC